MDHILVWAIVMEKKSQNCKMSHVLEIVYDIFGSYETLWTVKRAIKNGNLDV